MSTPPFHLIHPLVNQRVHTPAYFVHTPSPQSTVSASGTPPEQEEPLLSSSTERELFRLLESPGCSAESSSGATGIPNVVAGPPGVTDVSGACPCSECNPPRPQTPRPQPLPTPLPRDTQSHLFTTPPVPQKSIQSWQFPFPPPVHVTSIPRHPLSIVQSIPSFRTPYYPVAPVSPLPSGCSAYCVPECSCVHVHHFHF